LLRKRYNSVQFKMLPKHQYWFAAVVITTQSLLVILQLVTIENSILCPLQARGDGCSDQIKLLRLELQERFNTINANDQQKETEWMEKNELYRRQDKRDREMLLRSHLDEIEQRWRDETDRYKNGSMIWNLTRLKLHCQSVVFPFNGPVAVDYARLLDSPYFQQCMDTGVLMYKTSTEEIEHGQG
jgi:hypothetical protein